MKSREEVEVYLHTFLASAPDGGDAACEVPLDLMSFEDALNIFFLENCGYYKDLKIRILT
jgi:hypothetical protein